MDDSLQTLIAFAECAVKVDLNSAILTGTDDHNPSAFPEAACELPCEALDDVVFRDPSEDITDFIVSSIILFIIFLPLICCLKIIIYTD